MNARPGRIGSQNRRCRASPHCVRLSLSGSQGCQCAAASTVDPADASRAEWREEVIGRHGPTCQTGKPNFCDAHLTPRLVRGASEGQDYLHISDFAGLLLDAIVVCFFGP